jgi:8-oxo-dGTP diphosphatase
MKTERRRIAVGVIFDAAGERVLLARRPQHLAHGGLWEFPGGKCNAGEAVESALRRELLEELDLMVDHAAPWFRIDHDYPEGSVTLDVWRVCAWRGKPVGREGQHIEWVPVTEVSLRDFPAANRAIVRALSLPPLYVITPDLEHYDEDFFARLRRLLEAGLRLLQFRSTRLDPASRSAMAGRVVEYCAGYGCAVLINGDLDEALSVGAGGVHLTGARLMRADRRPDRSGLLAAASCHDAAELKQAGVLDLDFAVLGPVRHTASHPGSKPLGWPGFRDLVRHAGLPVYALGGMQPHDLRAAKEAGAHGVAMISGIWSAADPVAALAPCARPAGSTMND